MVSSHPQLIGALGDWMQARPDGVSQDDLDIAAGLVLSGSLLGVALDDHDAPQIAELKDKQLSVAAQAREWATAKRIDDERREAKRDRDKRRRTAQQASETLGAAERKAAERVTNDDTLPDSSLDEGEHGPVKQLRPSAAAANPWLTEIEGEPADKPARRWPISQEMFWWMVCALALGVLVFQLVA